MSPSIASFSIVKRPSHAVSGHRGITVIELLVAMVLVGVVLVLVSAAMLRAGKRSRELVCVTSLRQASAALLAYTIENRGLFPHSVQPSDLNDSQSGNLFWATLLVNKGYASNLKIFYCPEQKERPKNLSGAYVGYGSNRYGLMPGYNELTRGYRPASINAIKRPSRVLLLAESEVGNQPNDGWYEFWADFQALEQSHDRSLVIFPRHGKRAHVAFVDGHIQLLDVRRQIYGETVNQNPVNYPWVKNIYTRPNYSYEPR